VKGQKMEKHAAYTEKNKENNAHQIKSTEATPKKRMKQVFASVTFYSFDTYFLPTSLRRYGMKLHLVRSNL
jgi:hypothetical protein